MPTAFGAVDLVTLMHVNIIYNGNTFFYRISRGMRRRDQTTLRTIS